MKNKLIILLLLFTTWQTKAQKDDYMHLLDTNKLWIEAMMMEFGDIMIYENYTGERIVYNDTVYYELFTGDKSPYYLREDTIEQKVYNSGYYYDDDNEGILYDFSLQVGDSILLDDDWFWVDSVNYENVLGVERKVMFLYLSVWIEGIGSLAGILQNKRQPDIYNMGGTELNCCYLNNKLIYQSYWASVYGCHFEYLDVNDLSQNNEVRIYPNPVCNYLYIETKNNNNKVIFKLYDLSGNLIMQEIISSGKTEINITNYQQGVYIIKLISDNQIIYTNKLIKQ